MAKSATAAKSTKSNKETKARREAMPNGQSVHASLPTREPNWGPKPGGLRRVAVVKAMRKLGAVSASSARTAGDIAKVAGVVAGVKLTDRVDLVKVALDVYRPAELLHNGYALSVRQDGERELRYYLTKRGQKATLVNATDNGKA